MPIVLIGQNVEARLASITTITTLPLSWSVRLRVAWTAKIAFIGVTEEDRAAGYDRRRGFEAGLRARVAAIQA